MTVADPEVIIQSYGLEACREYVWSQVHTQSLQSIVRQI